MFLLSSSFDHNGLLGYSFVDPLLSSDKANLIILKYYFKIALHTRVYPNTHKPYENTHHTFLIPTWYLYRPFSASTYCSSFSD